MTAPLRVLFSPAVGPHIGGGHVLRDLALAEALQARGAECVFAVPAWGESLLRRFAGHAVRVHPVDRSGGDLQAVEAAVRAFAPAVLVLDDYTLCAVQTAPLGRAGLAVVVIDDLADRSYACDLLIDPGFGRAPSDYGGRTPGRCRVLTGPRYALLRPAFARAATEPLPPTPDTLETLFVSFGLADPQGVTGRIVQRLLARAPAIALDVALGSDAQSLPRLRDMAAAKPKVRLHVDALDVAMLMAAADAAIGAGGSSTWERCALGLPALAVVVADNQRAMIGRLAAAGAVLAADIASPDFDDAFDAALDRLRDPQVRRRLSDASRNLCDGLGAARAAEAIEGLVGRGGEGSLGSNRTV